MHFFIFFSSFFAIHSLWFAHSITYTHTNRHILSTQSPAQRLLHRCRQSGAFAFTHISDSISAPIFEHKPCHNLWKQRQWQQQESRSSSNNQQRKSKKCQRRKAKPAQYIMFERGQLAKKDVEKEKYCRQHISFTNFLISGKLYINHTINLFFFLFSILPLRSASVRVRIYIYGWMGRPCPIADYHIWKRVYWAENGAMCLVLVARVAPQRIQCSVVCVDRSATEGIGNGMVIFYPPLPTGSSIPHNFGWNTIAAASAGRKYAMCLYLSRHCVCLCVVCGGSFKWARSRWQLRRQRK